MTKEELMKDIDKSFERKKPIEKSKPKTVKGSKKPGEVLPVEKIKKKPSITKEETKIIEDCKKIMPVKEKEKEIEIPKSILDLKIEDNIIEYEIHKTTKFDLNWYYFKRLFLSFEKWISAPYTKSFWEKRGFKDKKTLTTIYSNGKKIVEEIKEPEKVVNNELKEEIKKPISNHWDIEKPLTPEEIAKIRRIRELLKNDDMIFRSDK